MGLFLSLISCLMILTYPLLDSQQGHPQPEGPDTQDVGRLLFAETYGESQAIPHHFIGLPQIKTSSADDDKIKPPGSPTDDHNIKTPSPAADNPEIPPPPANRMTIDALLSEWGGMEAPRRTTPPGLIHSERRYTLPLNHIPDRLSATARAEQDQSRSRSRSRHRDEIPDSEESSDSSGYDPFEVSESFDEESDESDAEPVYGSEVFKQHLKLPVPLPEDLAERRERIFNLSTTSLPATITMQEDEFKELKPWWDPVYYTRSKEDKQQNGTVKESFRCRYYRGRPLDSQAGKDPNKKRKRKTIRKAIQCRACIYVRYWDDGRVDLWGNGRKHCHEDRADMDRTKMPTGLQEWIREQLRAQWSPKQIKDQLSGKQGIPEIRKALETSGSRYVKTSQIKNIRNSLRTEFGVTDGPPLRVLLAHTDARGDEETQLVDVDKWFQEPSQAHYRYSRVAAVHDGMPSIGFVWARQESIRMLTQGGILALMDSTHNSTAFKQAWYLFTIFARDEYNSWIPCAFFYLKHQNSSMISEALKVIIDWSGGFEHGWKLEYMLTDDSSAEQLAVRRAFNVRYGDEFDIPKVQHLLCTRHCKETLLRRYKGQGLPKEAYEHMLKALYVRKSKDGCLESIDRAIDICQQANDQVNVRYLRREWRADTVKWAHWFRARTSLLLQCATTNPVEAWHSKLKSDGSKQRMSSGGTLLNGVLTVWHGEEDMLAKAEAVANKSRKTQLPFNDDFPNWGLEVLPFNMLSKIEEQFQAAQQSLEDGNEDDMAYCEEKVIISGFGGVEEHSQLPSLDDSRLASMPHCACHWYRKWQLPCKHIFLHQLLFGLLTKQHFVQVVHLWKDSGFDLYHEMKNPFHDDGLNHVIGIPRQRKINFGEVINGFWEKLYEAHETLQQISMAPSKYEARMEALELQYRVALNMVKQFDVKEVDVDTTESEDA